MKSYIDRPAEYLVCGCATSRLTPTLAFGGDGSSLLSVLNMCRRAGIKIAGATIEPEWRVHAATPRHIAGHPNRFGCWRAFSRSLSVLWIRWRDQLSTRQYSSAQAARGRISRSLRTELEARQAVAVIVVHIAGYRGAELLEIDNADPHLRRFLGLGITGASIATKMAITAITTSNSTNV